MLQLLESGVGLCLALELYNKATKPTCQQRYDLLFFEAFFLDIEVEAEDFRPYFQPVGLFADPLDSYISARVTPLFGVYRGLNRANDVLLRPCLSFEMGFLDDSANRGSSGRIHLVLLSGQLLVLSRRKLDLVWAVELVLGEGILLSGISILLILLFARLGLWLGGVTSCRRLLFLLLPTKIHAEQRRAPFWIGALVWARFFKLLEEGLSEG